MKKGKLRILKDGSLSFYCPGCKGYHTVTTGRKEHPVWSFDENYENPTFSPSILVRSGHYVPGHKKDDDIEEECWCKYNKANPEKAAPFTCGICHSFVKNGKIQYLNDCTHELAGKTIDMIEPDKE